MWRVPNIDRLPIGIHHYWKIKLWLALAYLLLPLPAPRPEHARESKANTMATDDPAFTSPCYQLSFHWLYRIHESLSSVSKVFSGEWGKNTIIYLRFLNNNSTRKVLTHWGRVTPICASKCTVIGSDNSLAPTRLHIVNWAFRNKLQWNFNCNSYIFIHEKAFENVIWKMTSFVSRPQCVKETPCYGLTFPTFLQTKSFDKTHDVFDQLPLPGYGPTGPHCSTCRKGWKRTQKHQGPVSI